MIILGLLAGLLFGGLLCLLFETVNERCRILPNILLEFHEEESFSFIGTQTGRCLEAAEKFRRAASL